MHLAIHWDLVDIMQVFSSRLINKLLLLFRSFANVGYEVRWSTQYIPHKKYEVSHGILHGQAVIWC